jgi:hypothetical protein
MTAGSGNTLRETTSASVSGAIPDASEDLAATLSDLGRVHVSIGKLHESEKEEAEALCRVALGCRDWR